MPEQGHIYVGAQINSVADLHQIAKRLNIPTPTNVNDLYEWDDNIIQAASTIVVEGKPREVAFYRAEDYGFRFTSKNTVTGATGNTYMLVGVALTSRYSPAIIDKGWDRGGRAEPFSLDLERLAAIQVEVRNQWPEAEILLLTA